MSDLGRDAPRDAHTDSQPGKAAVLGSPIAHSLSPALHRAAYTELNLDWTYEAVECDEASLPGFLDGLDPSWAGLSLTMPLKRAVLPLLDEVSELASAVGGANTVVLAGGRRYGDNTDVPGMVDALASGGVTRASSAVVLGTGATACSALAALRELGVTEVVVAARDFSRTRDLAATAARLGSPVRLRRVEEVREGGAAALAVDVLISTLPSGAADQFVPLLTSEGGSGAGAPATVFDVVYDPWPTNLAEAGRRAGSQVIGGFELLLHQAARQVQLMTGYENVPIDAMRDAGKRVMNG